jgi:hypothetical protein
MREVAEALAAESKRVLEKIEWRDDVPLAASEREMEMAVRLPSASDVAHARKILAAVPGSGQLRERPQIYARETVLLAEGWPKTVQVPVQAMRIGSLGIATLPGEAFVELGIEIKSKSPFKPAMPIELANAYLGYIPTVEGHEQGGYETWRAKSSFLEKQAAPKIVASAIEQLRRLAG